MIGQFLFPLLPTLGLRTRALVRNTERGREHDDWSGPPLHVDVKVFEEGCLRFHNSNFGEVPANGLLEVSETNCPALAAMTKDDASVVITTTCEPANDHYFPQEHQVFYENRQNGHFTTLVYDHSPVLSATARPSPIILLGPKLWISQSVNCFVIFTNARQAPDGQAVPEPLNLRLLTADGQTLFETSHTHLFNSSWVLDVHAALGGKLTLTPEPQFLNVVARGGSSMYVIMTLMQNKQTGNIALEHSFPPGGYISGDIPRLRREAMIFSS